MFRYSNRIELLLLVLNADGVFFSSFSPPTHVCRVVYLRFCGGFNRSFAPFAREAVSDKVKVKVKGDRDLTLLSRTTYFDSTWLNTNAPCPLSIIRVCVPNFLKKNHPPTYLPTDHAQSIRQEGRGRGRGRQIPPPSYPSLA